MSEVKASGQARGAGALIAIGELLPVPLLAWAAGLPVATRLFNLLVTNVPGPASALHLLGREMREAYPVALLPRGQALAIAILSYDGALGVGLLADPEALPELDALAGWLEEELAALAASRRSAQTNAAGGPRRATATSTRGERATAASPRAAASRRPGRGARRRGGGRRAASPRGRSRCRSNARWERGLRTSTQAPSRSIRSGPNTRCASSASLSALAPVPQ